MAREGTRSSTGHAAPRQFATVDTAPAIKRKPATKKASSKPTGVTKKVAPKKENSVVKKVKTAVKKGETKVKKSIKKTETKAKAPKTKKAAATK